MNVLEFKSGAMMAKDLVKDCTHFELRGIKSAALVEVTGQANIRVLRIANDWSDIVGDRPLVDNRVDSLPDLIPSARQQMDEIFRGLNDRVKAAGAEIAPVPKPGGPRMS